MWKNSAGMVLFGALLLTGCGGSSLEAVDPAGYEACQTYAEAAEITGDPLGRMELSFKAGDHASQASTQEIRGAAREVAGEWLTDGDAMAEACEANGVEIP